MMTSLITGYRKTAIPKTTQQSIFETGQLFYIKYMTTSFEPLALNKSPHQILRTLYNSLIHLHLIYGLYIWGFSPKRLTVLQKKVVRILARRPYISHTTSIFKDLKILKLKDQYSIQLYKLYHKNTNNLLPSYFNSFTPYYDVEHNHDLRYTALRLPIIIIIIIIIIYLFIRVTIALNSIFLLIIIY